MTGFPSETLETTLSIRPFWKIVPPWEAIGTDGVSLVLNPGAGFGTGAHETTQLCLQALGIMAPRGEVAWRMLDFGSGSGILSIGAAKLGARVVGVEIDEAAIANGEENSRLNSVSDRISYSRDLAEVSGEFEIVIANVLRPTLLEFASEISRRVAPGGRLILSGLVATDLPEVRVRYSALLGGRDPEIYQRGEWRAMVWRKVTSSFSDSASGSDS